MKSLYLIKPYLKKSRYRLLAGFLSLVIVALFIDVACIWSPVMEAPGAINHLQACWKGYINKDIKAVPLIYSIP
ncbi:hypothetical protein ACFLZT_01155 [Thermodesulfobacteriota bacterium]